MSTLLGGNPPSASRPAAPDARSMPDAIAEAESFRATRRLTQLILVFAVAYAVLIMSPAFLTASFGLYPLMKLGDATDVLTPLVILPLYWLLFRVRKGAPASVGEIIAFVALAALWVEGQGMHLAANSIGHLLSQTASGNAYTLTEFYDEVLSHYLWHVGVVGLTVLIVLRQWRHPCEAPGPRRPLIVASLVYGFTYFASVVEAQTAPLGVPFALALVLFGLARGRAEFRRQPLLAFFVGAQLVSIVLFATWGVYWGGLPEFSKLGFID